jgi:hypothetical protein
MTIDKELFYASHGLKYPVVARPYTDDMVVKEKFYTEDEVIAMLTELKNKLIDKSWNIDMYDDDLDFECCYLNDIDDVIQQKINALKAESEVDNGNDD